MKQLIIILLILFTCIKTFACTPHNKTKISIESYIVNVVDSLEKKGIDSYISTIEMFYCAKNIESEIFGFLIWYNNESDKYISIYVTNKCRKFTNKCPLEIQYLEYEYPFLLPEYNVLVDYYRKFEQEIKNDNWAEPTDDNGRIIIPNPYNYQKIKINDEGFHFVKTVEQYKLYSRYDLEGSYHLDNFNTRLFPIFSIINEMKYKTMIFGKRVNAKKIYNL